MHATETERRRGLPGQDTIVAVATPAGRGGIGVIRISGAEALGCAAALLAEGHALAAPHRQRLCTLYDPATKTRLDEALLTFSPAPRSYTGEDVVEISAHGSPVVLERIVRIALEAGARLAQPGEFTERAFLSGRLDLTQAEAVRDLVDAQTLLGAQVAAQQLGGTLARTIAPQKAGLIGLIATLEAGIDFAEDDTPVVSGDALCSGIDAVIEPLRSLERTFSHGRLITDGATLAIVGRPNAGKSSLFNRLLARERAIVTAEPGTTRDTVQERLSVEGIALELIDTAGLREAANEAERIGIARTREVFAEAALVLLVLDGTEALNEEEEALLEAARARPLVVALNKSDLLRDRKRDEGSELPSDLRSDLKGDVTGDLRSDEATPAAPLTARVRQLAPAAQVVATSAQTGEGVEQLRQAAAGLLMGDSRIAPESAMLTSLRQHTAVTSAMGALARARGAAAAGTPHEMLLLDLYAALTELDNLTGTTTPDDILHLIFSTFCIGK